MYRGEIRAGYQAHTCRPHVPAVQVAACATPATAPTASDAPKPRAGRRGPAAAIEARDCDVAPVSRLTGAERAARQAGPAAGLAEVERAEDLGAAELQARWDGLAGDEDEDREDGDYVDAHRASPPSIA